MINRFNEGLNSFFQKNPESFVPTIFISFLLALYCLFTAIGSYIPKQMDYVGLPEIPITTVTESKNLYVVRVSPENGSRALPDKLTFVFNEQVGPEVFAKNFSIRPKIEGSFSISPSNSNAIVFTPIKPFDPDIVYSITIDKNLMSMKNKPMLSSFGSYFDTTLPKPHVSFISDSIDGRLMSFSAGKDSAVTVHAESISKPVTATLYKSDLSKLLSFMNYAQSTEQVTPTYSYYYDKYLLNSVAHPADSKLQSIQLGSEDGSIAVPREVGIYYLEAKSDDNAVYGSSFVVVNNLGVVMRQDDKNVVLSAFDTNSGRAIEDKMDLRLYNLEKRPTVLVDSDLQGVRNYALPFAQRLDLVTITRGSDTAVIPVRLSDTQAEIRVDENLDRAYKFFVYTDKPIYQPNDTVRFRGIVRTDRDALYSLSELSTVRIQLGYAGKDEGWLTVPVDSHGVFAGEFKLTEARDGYEAIYARAPLGGTIAGNSYSNYQGVSSFEVAKYIKPEFDISVEKVRPEALGDENVEFRISGKYFDGKPLSNRKVTYSVFSDNYFEPERAAYGTNFNINGVGGMCGGGGEDYLGDDFVKDKEIALDANGMATVTVQRKKSDSYLSQLLTLVAKTVDQNSNELSGADNTVVHAAEFTIFFPPISTRFIVGETVVVPFYAESLTGEKVANKEFNYWFGGYTYDGKNSTEKQLVTGKVTTNSDGRGDIRFTAPPEAAEVYSSLTVWSTDSKGNKSENKRYISVFKPASTEDPLWMRYEANAVNLKMRTVKNSYQVGDTIELLVNSTEELDTLLTLERGRVYNPQIVHLKKGENTVSIPVTAEHSPSITPVFSYFSNGKYYSEGMSLNVPAMHKLLTVDVTTDKSKYLPSEKAQLKVSVKNAKKEGVSAQISLGIVDRAIFALRDSSTAPFHSSMFFFRGRSTNASSSLTWVGQLLYGGKGGGGGGEGGGLIKSVDTLVWSPNLQTDNNGEYTTEVDLKGILTTWRAQVYASTDSTDVGEGNTEFIVAQ